jgi:UDP-2,4-diacetamido-2,4,6-trideoxy-beta-L-altropyranose hydrolase
VSQAADADETIEALGGSKVDWMVIDHYGLDVVWERNVRPHTAKLMVIDDLANRVHDCDVLLDQNYYTDGESRYSALVPERCIVLAGPRYALLRREYVEHRRQGLKRSGNPQRVFAFFGGSDLHDMTGIALKVLARPPLDNLDVDIVIGDNYARRSTLEREATIRPRTTIHSSRPHLAGLMAAADLAIGAAGATTWERMCLGLPAIVIAIAENQRPSATALERAGLIRYAGFYSDVRPDALWDLITASLSDAESLADLSERNQLLVDGLGTSRTVEMLIPSPTSELSLRDARRDDISLYYNWANEPKVRQSAINSAAISWPTHKEWFAKKLADPNCYLFVLEAAGLPVGQIRFDADATEALISYSLDPVVRGRGWGTRLVTLGAELLWRRTLTRLRAHVKVGNDASASAFLGAGFIENPSSLGTGYRSFCAEPVKRENNGGQK